jgi:hypothetical protein
VPGFKDQPPIDLSRPLVKDETGIHTELTATFNVDGQWAVIPTVVDGEVLDPEKALSMHRAGENPAVGTFDDLDEADRYARLRTRTIDEFRGDEVRALQVRSRGVGPGGPSGEQVRSRGVGSGGPSGEQVRSRGVGPGGPSGEQVRSRGVGSGGPVRVHADDLIVDDLIEAFSSRGGPTPSQLATGGGAGEWKIDVQYDTEKEAYVPAATVESRDSDEDRFVSVISEARMVSLLAIAEKDELRRLLALVQKTGDAVLNRLVVAELTRRME